MHSHPSWYHEQQPALPFNIFISSVYNRPILIFKHHSIDSASTIHSVLIELLFEEMIFSLAEEGPSRHVTIPVEDDNDD